MALNPSNSSNLEQLALKGLTQLVTTHECGCGNAFGRICLCMSVCLSCSCSNF